MHLVTKVIRTYVFSVETSRKCVSGMLEKDVSACIVKVTRWRRCDHKNVGYMPARGVTTFILSVLGMLFNQEIFYRMEKRFTEHPHPSASKCFSNVRESLLLNPQFILGNKKGSRQYFIRESGCLFLLYIITRKMCLLKKK